jgi:AcrR family transcriptional regulator
MFGEAHLTGAPARRQRAREDMRLAIIEAAGQIIAESGVDGLTIRAVAGKLGYSPGALYEYFESKEAILHAVYFGGAEGLGARCEQAVAGLPESATAIDALVALGHAYRGFALEQAEIYRLIFCTNAPPAPTAAPDTAMGGFGTLVRIASEGAEQGMLVDLPAPVIACAAWSAVHGFVSMEISGHVAGGDGPGQPAQSPQEGRERRDQLFDAVLRMVLVGLTPPEQRLQPT